MIRKHKNFARPRKAFEISRIKNEDQLVEKYGLKNKREIWKTSTKIGYFRHRAMDLAKAPLEEQKVLFGKLNAIGLKVSSIAEVLALTLENLLERRFQTIVYHKKIAATARHARQLIAHKLILIDGRVCNVPGYIVSVAEESKISIKKVAKPAKQAAVVETQAQVQEAKN